MNGFIVPRFFEIEINEEIRRYIPDFYLPDDDLYVELNCSRPDKPKRRKIDIFKRTYPFIKFKEIDLYRKNS